jgi:thioredoxin 1
MSQNRNKNIFIVLLNLLVLLFSISCSSNPVSHEQGGKTLSLFVELSGTPGNTLEMDSQGKLSKTVRISSSDGSIILFIDQGTILLDENRAPLKSLKVIPDPVIPVSPANTEIVSSIVDIQPQGAIINPSLKLTLQYDPSVLPQGVNVNDLWIYYYSGSNWEMLRYKDIDAGQNRVTTAISRSGKYSILAPVNLTAIKTISEPVHPSSSVSPIITLPQALANGKPTLAEFGRGTCIPCKQMKPVLESLAVEYQGKLNVPIVSVDEYRNLTEFYKVMAIPTQIGFDSSGKEVFRHIGFWPKDQIILQLAKLGVK